MALSGDTVSEEPKGDGDSTDAPLDESGPGDVLAEKKRLARRRILLGTAGAGAILATVSRANALVNVSACLSTLDFNLPAGLEGFLGMSIDVDNPPEGIGAILLGKLKQCQ